MTPDGVAMEDKTEEASFLTLSSSYLVNFNYRCPEEVYDILLSIADRINQESELSREEIGRMVSLISDWF